jgi:transcription elongation factor Elf1
MPQKLNYKLMCDDCGVVYLCIPDGVTNLTLIHCSQCGKPLETWLELEASFVT